MLTPPLSSYEEHPRSREVGVSHEHLEEATTRTIVGENG